MNSLTLRFPLISICPSLVLNRKVLTISGAGLLLFLLSFYLFQIQAIISEEYKIEEYQKKATELSRNISSLEMKAASLNSLENIENKIENLDFVKVEDVKYILVSKDYLVRETE